jgi:hypothetical protein
VLLRCEGVSCPVEGVAAVVDGTTRLRWIMHCAEVLPLGGAHLGTGCGRAWWVIVEESNQDGVDLLYEEAAQFVEP